MLGKQSAADVRHWQWTEKGREGDTVMCVRIHRLQELACVVAAALALEWKGVEGGDMVVHVRIWSVGGG